jgi:hypothetical protein
MTPDCKTNPPSDLPARTAAHEPVLFLTVKDGVPETLWFPSLLEAGAYLLRTTSIDRTAV